MMTMQKIDVAAIKAAFRGETVDAYADGRPLKLGFPSEIAAPRMEHLWSRAVATSGNRWQMQTP